MQTMKRTWAALCRETILISLLSLAPAVALADAKNPFFGEHENMLFFGIGQGLSTGWLMPNRRDEFVPMGMLHAAYAVPNTAFHLPGRQSLNIMAMVGWGTSYDHRYNDGNGDPIAWNWKKIAQTAQIFYFQQDAALFWGENWYSGIGMGMGMQRNETKRVDTKLVFSFRIFGGVYLTDDLKGEVFFQHFSNGSTGINYSYNTVGLGLGYSF